MADERPYRHFYPAPYQIERGNGKPGYDWHPAYCEAVSSGLDTQGILRSEARSWSKIDGFRAKFHDTKEEAMSALQGA
jgi:hypothetical protein